MCCLFQVLSSVQTEGNPVDCRFSRLQPYQLLTVELPAGAQGQGQGSWVDTCVYECRRDGLRRLAVTRVPLPSNPVSCSRHPAEAALLLGLSDSSLVLYDQRRGVSLLASCPVPPNLVAWHPAGAMALVGGGQGELVCFDVGLAPISVALVAEEVAPAPTLRLMEHLRGCEGIERLQWGTSLEGAPEGANLLLLVFHGGPLAALRFRLGMYVYFLSHWCPNLIIFLPFFCFPGGSHARLISSFGRGFLLTASVARCLLASGALALLQRSRVQKVHSTNLTFLTIAPSTAI